MLKIKAHYNEDYDCSQVKILDGDDKEIRGVQSIELTISSDGFPRAVATVLVDEIDISGVDEDGNKFTINQSLRNIINGQWARGVPVITINDKDITKFSGSIWHADTSKYLPKFNLTENICVD